MTSPLFNGMIGGSMLGLMVIGSESLTTNIVVNIPVTASITGVAAAGGVGSFSISASSNAHITGVAAAGGVGTMAAQVSHTFPAISAATAEGAFAIKLSRTITLPPLLTAESLGKFKPTPTLTLHGVAATGHVGTVTPMIFGEGHGMANLKVVVQPTEDLSRDVSLRYSDTKGASWGNGVLQPLGNEGQYLTSMQWRRLGMGRDRIFEVSWTVPCETSIVGAFLEYDTAET